MCTITFGASLSGITCKFTHTVHKHNRMVTVKTILFIKYVLYNNSHRNSSFKPTKNQACSLFIVVTMLLKELCSMHLRNWVLSVF